MIEEPRTLYVHRPVTNSLELLHWAQLQGLDPVPPASMHVTLVYSRTPVYWSRFTDPQPDRLELWPRTEVDRLGPNGEVIVLRFQSLELCARHREFVRLGCSHDYPSYLPHVTVAPYQGQDLSRIRPWAGPLVLGPEQLKVIDPSWGPGLI